MARISHGFTLQFTSLRTCLTLLDLCSAFASSAASSAASSPFSSLRSCGGSLKILKGCFVVCEC
ncbi:hypothetical protein Lalb_Chr08g0238261 [Lupinus albus]|uniref:Secreted protein n=1 Tax=Lupinus albus TaxID=3870 RepID=A0A6A4Q4Q9_LUPAL|nr:hypothetical protein Lalb_Chr08g0238261 [Lupinus albus]